MRTYGAKNADHESKRAAMVAAIAPMVMRAAPERPSLREMAKAAGVSVNNLRHYFGTREGVLEAVFAAMGIAGEPYIRRAIGFTNLPAPLGLRRLLEEIVVAWTPDELGGLHRSGISEGLGSPELGPAYVEHLLEPTLTVVEKMLEIWAERGEVDIGEQQLRTAGLALMAPVMLALLHQRGLGGARLRPLEFASFIETHVDGFLRGWGR
ncbi:MAG TPA: TetR/AcrR family transcriptional regulator [Enhygromyxa sp.]|nr:TetR/AcrR family transcriptional regulator [Enhygromyxa sp.]